MNTNYNMNSNEHHKNDTSSPGIAVFIRKFLVFLLLVPIMWTIGVYIYGRIAPGFIQKNVRVTYYRNFNYISFAELDTLKELDILIAGPSCAFRSFDPRFFRKNGLNIFIMGSSAQSPLQTEYLVKKYLKKLNPKLFIYVADMQAFSADGVEGWLFVLNNLKEYDADFYKATIPTKSAVLLNTINYNVMDRIRKQPEFTSKIEKYVGNGYIEYNQLRHDSLFYNLSYTPYPCVFPDNQITSFNNMIAEVRKRNIPIAIIQTPSYPKYFKRISNPQTIDSFFHAVPGTNYANFNYNKFEDAEFWDPIHLNQTGVERFDEMVLDSLKSWNLLKK